jgi:hypothetical protein
MASLDDPANESRYLLGPVLLAGVFAASTPVTFLTASASAVDTRFDFVLIWRFIPRSTPRLFLCGLAPSWMWITAGFAFLC